MSEFLRKLQCLLKKEASFVDDSSELLLDVICDRAWKLDHKLIAILLKDKEIEQKFFDQVSGKLIFNHNTFIDYLRDKNFLDNSYTRFRNKIGLNIGGKFLQERNEVSLVWPYKDCVLEGGQTKDEEKREEIFFNEILAHDEINRLLDPKVLANWKRHTTNGVKKVQKINRDESGTIRENMLIKGNNLLTLHSLVEQFRSKIKLIYIDPPYNTGSDSFGYNDRFNHSSWLTFMRNRLEIARELLRDDGLIFIQIDNRELFYVKCLCDEIFGGDNFRNSIVCKKGQKNLQKQFDAIDRLTAGYDTIILYSKASCIKIPNLFKLLQGDHQSSWNNHWRGTDRPTMRFELLGLLPKSGQWRWNKQRTYKAIDNYSILVSFIKRHGISEKNITNEHIDTYYHRYLQENSILSHSDFEIIRLSKNGKPEHYIPATNKILLSENWMDINIVGRQSDFEHEKNEEIVRRIVEWLTNGNDIVLDFFAGSGTTAAVAHKMNRQWIAVEQMDYIDTVTVERLNKVIAGEQGGISKSVNWQGGGDFLYCELMPYAQTYVDRIQRAQSSRELDKLWQEISRSTFLNWYINNEDPSEARKTFAEINYPAKQKQLLMDLLDKNQLYVHYSEIDDADYKVSSYDKKLSRLFYGD